MSPLIYFGVGLGLLLLGANGVVNSALAIASRTKISPLIIGITAVAIGTSLPEIIVTIFGGLDGGLQLALGNIIGSNIANIGLVLGISVLSGTIVVGKQKTQENMLLYLVLSLLIFSVLALGKLGFLAGAALLLLGHIVLIWQVSQGVSGSHAEDKTLVQKLPRTKQKSQMLALSFAFSLAALIIGGKLLVDSAITMAREFHVSQAVIGLTAVAVGTSLPELAVSAIGLKKRQGKLVIGNILGSNIFNILFGGGILGLYRVNNLSDGMTLTFFLTISMVFCFVLFKFKGRKVPRYVGGVFLMLYSVYIYTLVVK